MPRRLLFFIAGPRIHAIDQCPSSRGRFKMKHHVIWLVALPVAMALASAANAGFRCGGCSDPCRSGRGGFGHHGHRVSHGAGTVSPVYESADVSGCSLFQASPASCGTVTADGSYSVVVTQAASSAFVVQAPAAMMAAPTAMAIAPQVVCEPITGYRTVMESTFVTETQYVTVMETKQETRQRVKKVSKSIPVTVDDFRTKTVMVPTTETKTIEYTVLVPEQSTKTVDVTVSVPVWNEISENYTVKVPVVSEVQETYNVNVARLKDETFTYTVYAPQTETVTKTQTVTNAVPVVKTRTVQRSVPKYSTQTVSKDYGHWETVVEEVAGSSYGAAPVMAAPVMAAPAVYYSTTQAITASGACGHASATTVVRGGGCGTGLFGKRTRGCGCRSATASNCACNAAPAVYSTGCASQCDSQLVSSGTSCGSNMIVSGSVVSGGMMASACESSMTEAMPSIRTTTRQVWVPNVVMEEVPVVTSEVRNEEVAYTVYEQQSTEIPYECVYVVYRPEQRTGTKKVVEYVPEPRTRTRKVVSYNDEQRTRSRRELSYKTEVKQETYPVVTYRTEKKTKDISFTIQVPTQTVEPFQTTRYETVTEDVVEDYTVNVQVPATKEVQVQVCKMVPKLVPYTFNPCASSMSVSGTGVSGTVGTSAGQGCGCAAQVAAPVTTGCGCGN